MDAIWAILIPLMLIGIAIANRSDYLRDASSASIRHGHETPLGASKGGGTNGVPSVFSHGPRSRGPYRGCARRLVRLVPDHRFIGGSPRRLDVTGHDALIGVLEYPSVQGIHRLRHHFACSDAPTFPLVLRRRLWSDERYQRAAVRIPSITHT